MRVVHCLRFILLVLLSFGAYDSSMAQEKEFIAVIPAFHDRLNTSSIESPLRLEGQRFVLFVYENAVAVFSEADFVNMGVDTLSQEFALPSTGHDENGDKPGGRISSGILSAQLWVGGERVEPETIHDGSQDWYTISSKIAPGHQCRVRAVFWAQTSLTDIDSLPGLDTVAIANGKRGFMVDLSHAVIWKGAIESARITVVIKGGMSFTHDSFSAVPDAYNLQDSTITWTLRDVEPSLNDNICVFYRPAGSAMSSSITMAQLSTYIVRSVYGELLDYVERNQQE
jgi:hypothetical protein